MKKIFSFFIFCYFVFLTFPVKANQVLFVSPTRVELSRRNKITTLNIANMDSKRKYYKLDTKDLIMTENGTTKQTDSFEYSAKRMIRFVPRYVDIAPGETQTVRVLARIRGKTPDGEYHTHLKFRDVTIEKQREEIARKKALGQELSQQEKGQVKMSASVVFSVGIPVSVKVGKTYSTVDFLDAKLVKNEKTKKHEIITELKRQGNSSGVVYADVFHKDTQGNLKQIRKKIIIRIYREVDKITKKIIVADKSGKAFQAGDIELILYSDKNATINDKDKIIGKKSFSIN